MDFPKCKACGNGHMEFCKGFIGAWDEPASDDYWHCPACGFTETNDYDDYLANTADLMHTEGRD